MDSYLSVPVDRDSASWHNLNCCHEYFFGTLVVSLGALCQLLSSFNIDLRVDTEKGFKLGKVSKKRVFGTLSQTMGRWGSKVPNFLVRITIQSSLLQTHFFLGLRPKIGVAVGGWGSRVPNKYMEFCPKNCSFFQKKQKNKML